MEILNKTKTSLKGSITRIETFVQKLSSDINNTELEVKLKKVDQLQLKIDEIRDKSFGLEKVQEAELKELESDLDQCEIRLEELEVRIKTLLNSNKKSISVTESNQNGNESVFKTKIPSIMLPTFSGKYEHFSSFKNQFDDLITKNDQLTQSQKLYYLNSCLSNEVKEFASAFDTFSSLYEALESRYENKRLIVDIHVQSILNFRKIERENALEIREMIDCITKNLRSLKVLNYEQSDLFNIFLINIMLKKLDNESRKNFELIQKTKEVPTFEEFIAFLEQREAVLLSIDRNCYKFESKSIVKKPFSNSKNKTVLMNQKNENKKCLICSKSFHPIFRCEKFLQLTPQKRFELVRLHKLCMLCLNQNHKKIDCTSTYICPCSGRHAKILCFRQAGERKALASENQKDSSISREIAEVNNQNKSSLLNDSLDNSSSHTVLSSVSQQNKKSILLSTGNIFLKNKNGKFIKCRAIFDSASNTNILSRKISEFLGIKLEKVQTSVSGLNSMQQNVKGKLNTFISNENGRFREPIEFLVTDKITCAPSATLDISEMKIPEFLELADPCFYEAKEIHALLNADIFFRIMKDNVYRINDELLFRETLFGWIAGGRLNEIETSDRKLCFLLKNDSSLEDTLKLFFELESLGIKDDPCIRDEDRAIEIFTETVQYNNGRYTVELPFRKHWKELSDNFPVAKQRFFNLWRRLQRNGDLYSEYSEIIQDYLKQGIVEKIENPEINTDRPTYYLPHQAVKKEGRITTSTRIVFDAASHQANELSLNDCLWPGPNLYPNLLDVLIYFRLNKIAISSDIRQAFLQICIADHHRDAMRFLWTDSNPEVEKTPILQVYRFNRVIFGVNASPFLLAATIKHHIEKYRDKYPTTVHHLDNFMYVDDFITGLDSVEEALLTSRCAKNIMNEAGMVMRKWITNDSALMRQWAAEGFDTYPIDTSVNLGINKTKVLGMTWQTQEDCLTLDTKSLLEFISANRNTKRFILQVIGKIFDPLGLLTPYTIRMKCLIQELWKNKITWDENLPSTILERWLNWCKELPVLDELKIPRLVLDSFSVGNIGDIIEIHTFCDASKVGYGASVYVKVKNQNNVSVNLVTSKSRVAPLKSITLPRLELLGALVAARLSCKVQQIISQKRHYTAFHWTDSSIVLFWIKGSSKRWKQFVRNRVEEITNLSSPDTWFHCSGKDNPSDLLSRGISAESLLHSEKWWHGPPFLQSDELPETVCEFSAPDEEQYITELKSTELKENLVLTVRIDKTFFDSLVNLSNRFLTVVRILSFIFRFLHNCRNSEKEVGL